MTQAPSHPPSRSRGIQIQKPLTHQLLTLQLLAPLTDLGPQPPVQRPAPSSSLPPPDIASWVTRCRPTCGTHPARREARLPLQLCQGARAAGPRARPPGCYTHGQRTARCGKLGIWQRMRRQRCWEECSVSDRCDRCESERKGKGWRAYMKISKYVSRTKMPSRAKSDCEYGEISLIPAAEPLCDVGVPGRRFQMKLDADLGRASPMENSRVL